MHLGELEEGTDCVHEEACHDGIPTTRLGFVRIRFPSVNFLKVTFEAISEPTISIQEEHPPATREKLDVGGKSDGRTSGMRIGRRIELRLVALENE